MTFQIYQQHRYIRRRYPCDTGGLADAYRAVQFLILYGFDTQTLDLIIIHIFRDLFAFQFLELFHLF